MVTNYVLEYIVFSVVLLSTSYYMWDTSNVVELT